MLKKGFGYFIIGKLCPVEVLQTSFARLILRVFYAPDSFVRSQRLYKILQSISSTAVDTEFSKDD